MLFFFAVSTALAIIRKKEIETAVEFGADEIMLPMVRNPGEVEASLKMIGARARLGILVETMEALQCAADLGEFPLSRVYVGLNDLAIERKSHCIFTSISDGTVDDIRPFFRVPFGIAGLTHPECGEPVPCRLLINEMSRLNCSYSFLRRSFCRDIEKRGVTGCLSAIREALKTTSEKSLQERNAEHVQFCSMVDGLEKQH